MRREFISKSIKVFKAAEDNNNTVSDAITFLEGKGATAFEIKSAWLLWQTKKEFLDIKNRLKLIFKRLLEDKWTPN
jgi:hypothetical protein